MSTKVALVRVSRSHYKTADDVYGIVNPMNPAGHWTRWPAGWSVYDRACLLSEISRHHRSPESRLKVRLDGVIKATFDTLGEAKEHLEQISGQ